MSVAVVTVAVGLFFGCDSQTRTDSANRNDESTQSTKTDVNTNDAAASEFRRYRLDAEDQLSQTDREIAQIRKRIVTENMDNRKDLEDRLQKIEKKNNDLKDKLADFKDDADVSKRDNFRKDFNEDITEVRQDVTNFWTNKTDDMRKNINRDNNTDKTNDNQNNNNPLR